MLLTLIIGSRTSAQSLFSPDGSLKSQLEGKIREWETEIIQDNEYTTTGYEEGNFYDKPLLLDGKPLDYSVFALDAKGELTVIKGAAKTGYTIKVPFYVYLIRNGNKVVIPGKEFPDPAQTSIEISEVLKRATPGDLLVIEPVMKEDGPAKRILKLRKSLGC